MMTSQNEQIKKPLETKMEVADVLCFRQIPLHLFFSSGEFGAWKHISFSPVNLNYIMNVLNET